jgi:hypothetical protein
MIMTPIRVEGLLLPSKAKVDSEMTTILNCQLLDYHVREKLKGKYLQNTHCVHLLFGKWGAQNLQAKHRQNKRNRKQLSCVG